MKASTEDRAFRLERNLTDAGCSRELIEQFFQLEQRGCRCRQYRLLARHKAALLEALHQLEYQIDCLDHLVYILHKEDA